MGISLKKALNRLFKSENGNTLMDARWNKKMKTTRQVLMQIKKIIEIIMRNSAFTQPVQAGGLRRIYLTEGFSPVCNGVYCCNTA